MKFYNFSRQEAGNHDYISPFLWHKHIWISITDPDSEKAKLQSNFMTKDVLRLEFHDVSDKYPDSDKVVKFSDEHRKKIADFVNKNSDVDFCLIHCEFGQSRSASIANALSQWKNKENADDFR